MRAICAELPAGELVLNECDLRRARQGFGPNTDVVSNTAFERRIVAAITEVGVVVRRHEGDAGALCRHRDQAATICATRSAAPRAFEAVGHRQFSGR